MSWSTSSGVQNYFAIPVELLPCSTGKVVSGTRVLYDTMQSNGHGATGVLQPDDVHVQGVGDAHVWLLPHPRHARQQERPREHQQRGVCIREEHGCWLLVWIRLVELSLAIIYTYTIIYIYMRYIWKWKSPFGRRHSVRSSPRIERHSHLAASYYHAQHRAQRLSVV